MAALSFREVSVTHQRVPLYDGPVITAKLAKVNKRLAKLGAPLATVAFGPKVKRTYKDEFGFGHEVTEYETVTVTGAEAHLAGWTGVAVLDHTLVADEAYVTRFPGQADTEVPEAFRTRGPVCDHCGVKINRNTTILFRSDEGAWQQVGTSCVLDFIGVDPATILWLAGPQFGVFDDDGERVGRARETVSPAYFLAVAAEVTREIGFRPTSFESPTRDLVGSVCAGAIKPAELAKILPDLDPERGAAAAAAILAWVPTLGNSDFDQSAKLACRADHVSPRTAGLLACLPNSHAKATAKKIEAEAVTPSEFVGTVGQKLAVEGTVVLTRTFASDYYNRPNSYLVVVQTEAGERVSTFGSGQTLYLAEQGDRVTMTGKVVEHADGQYGKETKLKMAKVTVHEAVTA